MIPYLEWYTIRLRIFLTEEYQITQIYFSSNILRHFGMMKLMFLCDHQQVCINGAVKISVTNVRTFRVK